MLLSLNIINDYFVHFVDLYTNSRPNGCRNEGGGGGYNTRPNKQSPPTVKSRSMIPSPSELKLKLVANISMPLPSAPESESSLKHKKRIAMTSSIIRKLFNDCLVIFYVVLVMASSFTRFL
jgi:hypothetical protein